MTDQLRPGLAPDMVPSIKADVHYLARDATDPFTYSGGPGSTAFEIGGKREAHRVVMRNGRLEASSLTLEQNGFRLVRHDTKMVDFLNGSELRRIYYPEMETLVRSETGAVRVLVFDHTLRTADNKAREAHKLREIVRYVHNDYTESSGPQRVRDLLPDEADDIRTRRFAIVQVWRPIKHTVENDALAVCDARSVGPDDLIVSERRYPNRVGEIYAVTGNPKHRWVWFPRMRCDETIVFKVYDSQKHGTARWTPHTAFEDPSAPPRAAPRESIEIRALALF